MLWEKEDGNPEAALKSQFSRLSVEKLLKKHSAPEKKLQGRTRALL
jgi:hypothetical protein